VLNSANLKFAGKEVDLTVCHENPNLDSCDYCLFSQNKVTWSDKSDNCEFSQKNVAWGNKSKSDYCVFSRKNVARGNNSKCDYCVFSREICTCVHNCDYVLSSLFAEVERAEETEIAECNAGVSSPSLCEQWESSTMKSAAGNKRKICKIKRKTFRINVLNQKVAKKVDYNTGPKFYVKVKVNETYYMALVDSGATISAISSDMVNNLGDCLHKKFVIDGMTTIGAFNGSNKQVKEAVEVHLDIAGEIKMWKFFVIDGLSTKMILGSDWMEKEGAVLDAAKRTLTFGSGNKSTPFETYPVDTLNNSKWIKFHLHEDTVFPARSAKRVLVECDDPLSAMKVLSPERGLQFSHGLAIPYVYALLVKGGTEILVTNLLSHNVSLNKNTVICYGDAIYEESLLQLSADSSKQLRERDLNFNVNLGKDLKVSKKEQLLRLIKKFRHVFAENELQMGKTGLVKHTISTGDNPPVHCHPYRTSFKERGEIRKRVDELERAGVVCPSNSPWSSPVILIPKKDGTYRFCIDYRKINAITKKDVYPLPRIEDALDNLGGAKYFSILDLISGFYQIEVDERDREKTAFITADGLYEFKRMPMGLCNSPASFQRLMDTIFRSMKWTSVLVYLDDLVVFGNTFSEMMQRLEVVLLKLSDANLTLKPAKCRFGEEKLSYLGHIKSKDGIAVDERKTEAMVKYPVPTNLREIRGFVNLCGYYRRFIKNFSSIAAPITQLLKKSEPFVWTDTQQQAFEKLKLKLVSPPILGFPQENAETIIYTDACGYGLGASITQIQEGTERVLAYASRTLSKTERNYSTTEQECLAILFAVEKFRPYVFHVKFKVITDHNALRWLFSVKDPNGRLARCSLKLQAYDMEVQHRPGKIHGNADALSRCPLDARSSEECSIWQLDLTSFDVKSLQNNDPMWKKIIFNRSNLDQEEKFVVKNLEDYCLKEGILYHALYSREGRSWCLCIPKVMKSAVLESVHSDPSGGHLGSVRMYSLVSARYYWPGMYRDVRRFVRCCRKCDLFRPKKGPHFGSMQSFVEATKPFVRVGMDFIGPFHESARGNRYVIVIIDHFSRYAEAMAVREANASSVILALREKVLFRHSCPKEIIVDRGSQFLSGLIREHSKKSNYKLRFTAPYHPQTNGMTERLNQTLKHTIRKFVDVTQTDWDDVLPCAVFAYNITVHESTKFSPFYLVYKTEPRIPADLELPVLSERTAEETGHEAVRLEEHAEEAVVNSRSAHERNKVRYDARRVEAEFSVGQFVWRFQPVRKKGLTQAFLPQKTGPYVIIDQISPVNFKIKLVSKSNRAKPFIVHVNDLRKVASDFEHSSDEPIVFHRKKYCKKYRTSSRISGGTTSKLESSSDSEEDEVPSSRGEGNRQSGIRSSNSATKKNTVTVDQTVDDDEESIVAESEAADQNPSNSVEPTVVSSSGNVRHRRGRNHDSTSNTNAIRVSTRIKRAPKRLIDEMD